MKKQQRVNDLSIVEENESRLEESSRYYKNFTNRGMADGVSRIDLDEDIYLEVESDLSIEADRIM